MPETREQMLERHNRELRSVGVGAAGTEYHIVIRSTQADAEYQIDHWMQQQKRTRDGGGSFTYVETRRG